MPKGALRQRLKTALQALTPEVIASRSAAVCRLLSEQPEYRAADVLMIYLPLPFEVDCQALAMQSWSDVKRVAAPRVSWDQRRMVPIEIASLSVEYEEDSYGIREAVSGPPVPIGELDLVVVPGLGFDLRGHRLGRGRGFYDRFLSHPDFRGIACGVGFEDQLVEALPTVETDVPMQMVVTDKSVRRFG